MNRETKIGLVTGVTLIVLIGAMLSSYLSAPHNNIGNVALNGFGSTMRSQISNPVGIAQVPIPQPAAIRQPQSPLSAAPVPPAVAPAAVAAAAAPYNQITQLPYGAATTSSNPAAAVVQTASTVTPEVVPVVVARQPAVVATTDAPTPSQNATYTVRSGDTLGKIAWHFYHDAGPVAMRRIVNANRAELGSAQAMIRVGETLHIPAASGQSGTSHVQLMTMAAQTIGNSYNGNAPRTASQRNSSVGTYRVQSGDTLWGIAKKTMGTGTDANVHRIMVLNHIRDARTISVGQMLKIPS